MDETKAAELRAYYGSLSDEGLLAEAAGGPDEFLPGAWQLIADAINARGLKSAKNRRRRLGTSYDPIATNRRGITVGLRWAAFPALAAMAWTLKEKAIVGRPLPTLAFIGLIVLVGIAIPVDLLYERYRTRGSNPKRRASSPCDAP